MQLRNHNAAFALPERWDVSKLVSHHFNYILVFSCSVCDAFHWCHSMSFSGC